MLTQCCCFMHVKHLIMQHESDFYKFLPFTAKSRTHFQLQAFPFDDLPLLLHAQVGDITYKSATIFVIARSDKKYASIIGTPSA